MIACVSLIIWIYLIVGHGQFWRSAPQLPVATPASLPDIDIIVPARDEAETIGAVIRSLLRQDYAGHFRVILVDDGSTDGTAGLAGTAPNLEVIRLNTKPPGWSGKLWALQQGTLASRAPLILFTDADIVHDERHLSALVAHLIDAQLLLVSEMVRLNCVSLAERMLVPAFIYFFQMLYPFRRVNNPRARLAAAAGGTILIRREALERVGGIDAIKHTLIDDVALAVAVKRHGPIFLGHSGLAASIRRYPRFSDIWNMVARTAFTQLRHSVWILCGTLVVLTMVWLLPPFAIAFGHGASLYAGLASCALFVASYLPTLQRYGRNKLWALMLPIIAIFYMCATVASAVNERLGRGANWKSRAYRD